MQLNGIGDDAKLFDDGVKSDISSADIVPSCSDVYA
jgi:hypothetical protein